MRTAAGLGLHAAVVLLLLAVAHMASAAEVAYKVEILGVADEELLGTLMAVSHLVAETDRPPPTLETLKRRAEDDIPRLAEALDSLGYYGARFGYQIDSAVSPVQVTLRIEPGEPYRLAGYHIVGDNPALTNGRIRISPETIGLQTGMVAAARPVVEAEQRLLASLAAQAYPLALVVDRKVVVDHAARSMTVDWHIDTGPYARFGAVTVEGLQSIDPVFVQARLPWEAGQPFDGGKVGEGRRALIDTRLFSSVRIAHADALDADGWLPTTVTVVENKHRSIGGGASYSTSDGPDGKAFWEHRNLFGAGERLTVTLQGGQKIQGLVADFRKPDLTNPRLTWLGKAQGLHENRETYDTRTVDGAGGVEYKLTGRVTLSGQLSLERSFIDDGVSEGTFTLLGVPLGLAYDTTDDLLDPARGTRLNLGATPYFSVADSDVDFSVFRLSDSFYIQVDEEHHAVLATWGRVGTILGGDRTADLPATKRLYGGGAGSVRAYGYQELGPIGPDGDPTGGRSQLEFGTELRWRMFGDFGAAVFVEGGNVYDDPVPDLSQRILWGAGFGLRYFTEFGPVRLDVAFPINPRHSDDPFQIYVGIGQAF